MKLILERIIRDPRGFNTSKLFLDNGDKGHEFICWTIHDLFEKARFIAMPVFYENGVPLIPELIMCHEAFRKVAELFITNEVKHLQIEFVDNYWFKYQTKPEKLINPYVQKNQEKPSLFSKCRALYVTLKEKIENVRI